MEESVLGVGAGSGVFVDGAAIVANARTAAPVLRAEAAENERCRRLTPRAVQALRSAGAFRMAMPRSWGGSQVDICTQVAILEELSAADGSAGWCATIGSAGGFLTAAFDDVVGRRVFPDVDTVIAGAVAPSGRLHRVEGGYRLEGRWQFASGCTHADVILSGAMVYEGGEPMTGTDGRPEVRYSLMPVGEFQIVDTWYTTGLSGSGSHDFTTTDTFVPAERTFLLEDLRKGRRDGALYAWPGLFFACFPAVPLGVGRAALDAAEDMLADKVMVPEMHPAPSDARVRAELARSHALVGSARSYAYDVLGDFWASLEAGTEPTFRQRAALGGLHVHTLRSCLDAVRTLSDIVGSASIYQSCPLERYGRDLMTIAQHVVAQPRRMELVGALWLGVEGIVDEYRVMRAGIL